MRSPLNEAVRARYTSSALTGHILELAVKVGKKKSFLFFPGRHCLARVLECIDAPSGEILSDVQSMPAKSAVLHGRAKDIRITVLRESDKIEMEVLSLPFSHSVT